MTSADLLTVAQIVFVNIVLSGDNALVIGTYANGLPTAMRRRAVCWGSSFSVVLQILFALGIGHLLGVPGLRLFGALALVFVARRLVFNHVDESHCTARSSPGAWRAVLAVVAANVAMSFDNVLAVGVISRGDPWLTAFGILVSAAVLLAASSLVVRILERFPSAIWGGAALLACTASGLICEEPLLDRFFNPVSSAEVAAALASAGEPVRVDSGVSAIDLAQSTFAAIENSLTGHSGSRAWFAYPLILGLCFAPRRLWRIPLDLEGGRRADAEYAPAECPSA